MRAMTSPFARLPSTRGTTSLAPLQGAVTVLAAALMLAGCAARVPEVPVVTESAAPEVEPVQAETVAASEPVEVAVQEEGEVAAAPAAPVFNRDDVLWIQQRLQELGYYNNAVDGAVGQATRNAVRAYQQDQDIRADGRPTRELRDFMWRNGG